MEKALNTLETYPETADEYVDYLLFLDDIQEQVYFYIYKSLLELE